MGKEGKQKHHTKHSRINPLGTHSIKKKKPLILLGQMPFHGAGIPVVV